MMKQGLTELVFILDRSGSMNGLESDTIGGFNSLLEKQKRESGEATVTTVLFDDRYELLHDRVRIAGVAPITGKEYFVRGSTALLDAVGRTITKIAQAQLNTVESERAEHVLFVIITDGMENASREYQADRVREMIGHRKDEDHWEFLFLGANIDAVKTAACYGIGADRAVRYNADSKGTALNYEVVSDAVSCMRSAQPIEARWKARIERDYEDRGR